MNPRIEHLATMTLICLRHIGPYPLIGEKFEILLQWASENQVPFLRTLGLWHDCPHEVPAEALRSDACLMITAPIELPPNDLDLKLGSIEGGNFAIASYIGPYEGLGAAWDKFCEDEVPKLGIERRPGAEFEVYVNDCSQVSPEELRTDLYIPVK